MLALVHNDDASQSVQRAGTAGPMRQDLHQPVWSLRAVLSDRAVDEFADQLGISNTDRLEQIPHPLKADGEPRPQVPGQVLPPGRALEILDETQQQLLVRLGQLLIPDGCFAIRSSRAD